MLLTILLGNPHILTRLFTLSFNGCVRLIARRVQLKIRYAYLYKNANSSPGPSRLYIWRQIGTATQAQIILSIFKVVLFQSLAGNDFSDWGTQTEAHCQRNLNRQL